MKEIIIAIIPLIGVLIGLGCTEFSRRITNAERKKKTINRVVTQLLELYCQMSQIIVVRNQVDKTIAWFVELFVGEGDNVYLHQIIKTQVKKSLEPLLAKVSLPNIKKLGREYDVALSALSNYDPVVAYKLKGGCDIPLFVKFFNDYSENISKTFQIEDELELEKLKVLAENPVYLQLEENNKLLKSAILTLAKKNDKKSYKDVKNALDSLDNDDTLEKQIEELKQKIVTFLQEMSETDR